MAAYYTRAKAQSEVEPEDVEQGDSASVATTTPTPIISVGLQGVSMRESGSMSTEVAGPVTTHPHLLPERGHSSVGGRGNSGSADSLQVGVATLGYPSGLADPLDSDVASARAFQFGQKKFRFDSRYRIDFFDSIRFANLINLSLVH